MADTRLGKIGISVKEPWAVDISYEMLDMTLYAVEDGGDGCSYVALKDNIGVTPGTDPTTWRKSTQAGQSIYDLAVKYHHFDGTEEEFEAQYQAALAAATTAAAAASATNEQVQAAEALRVTAEQGRASAESNRESAESARDTAESGRATAENARVSAETDRASAETARQAAESARASAETTRQTNEAARVSAETTRAQTFAALETDMQTAIGQADAAASAAAAAASAAAAEEAAVEAAEALRVTAESGRVTAENGRVSAESARVSAESGRATAETGRASAETARATAENGRADAEATRVTAESGRATAETAREAQASSDHAQAGNDHTRAESDHTRAGQDHDSIASLVVDNLTTDDGTKALSAKQGKVLNEEVSQLGQQITKLERGAKYIGIVNKDTVPSITGINIFALASTPGVYTHFDGIELGGGELAALYYNAQTQAWAKQTLRLNSVILNRFVHCDTRGNESNKTVALPQFYIYPEGNNPFFLMRMQEINTADNVTLNVNNTGAYPLLYRGMQMSSTNSPNYNYAYFIVFHFASGGNAQYIALEIPSGMVSELGDNNNVSISQAGLKNILTSQWLTNFHSETHFYEGYVNSAGTNAGKYNHSDVLIVSQGLTGYIRIKTKSPYCISSGCVYNVDGTFNRTFNVGTVSAGNSFSFYLDPTKEFARLNVRNIDQTQPISPDYDFLDYCYINIDEKRIVDGHTLFNVVIKELYLNGTDENKEYYVSSISKNNSAYGRSSLVVREKLSGDIVARYVADNTPNPSAFVKLNEENASGVSGLALIDWLLVNDGALITDSNNYDLLDSVRDINEWPQLSLYLNSASTRLIDSLNLVADDGVIHTAWNYVLKDVTIDGVRYLQFSDDLGETFTQAENIYGDIVYVHFFSNGVCLFATANKCYYFEDITDIHESTLLDENGDAYVSNCVLDFFQNDQSRNDAMIVGGKEIVTWGNYSLGGTQDPNYVARVWYSADYGATVKCAIKFGTTVISGETTGVRHVHGSLYNKYNEKFIIITGDAGNECQIIEGVYNPTNDSWAFTKLGQGDEFKFGDVLFREDFVYLVTDYTLSASLYPRGILRVPYEMLNDYSKYKYICKIGNYNGSLIGALEDENGNKLLFPDGAGAGHIWYCKHDFKFLQLAMSENVVITNVGSPNYNGEIYARKSQGSASFPFKLSPMVNLTKSMRNSGCVDFFVQDNVLL